MTGVQTCALPISEAGAHPYKRDLRDLEFHILDTGHFALEEEGAFIARRMLAFLDRVHR